jgi:hypothetical protein
VAAFVFGTSGERQRPVANFLLVPPVRRTDNRPVNCPNCGYDRSGLPAKHGLVSCPECGALTPEQGWSPRRVFWKHFKRAFLYLALSVLPFAFTCFGSATFDDRVVMAGFVGMAALFGLCLICGLVDSTRAWGRLKGRLGLPWASDLRGRRALRWAIACNSLVMIIAAILLALEGLACLIGEAFSNVN